MYSAERLVSDVNRIRTLTARYGSRSNISLSLITESSTSSIDSSNVIDLEEEEEKVEAQPTEEELRLLKEKEALLAASARLQRIRIVRDEVEDRLEEAADFLRVNFRRKDQGLPWIQTGSKIVLEDCVIRQDSLAPWNFQTNALWTD